ncbi:MAG: hypothetical protein E7525_01565 [Ruminococcaceae bacterium]|nr:hypothetical protein [Oscillospiraceae bacterium]
MLELNSTVFYGTTGVCVVENIEKKKIGRVFKNYYVLKPVAQCASTVYIPTDNEALLAKVRKVLSVDEVKELIDATDSSDMWIEDESKRKEVFGGIISAGTCSERLNLMRSIHLKQQELNEKSKRLHLSDERFFKEVSRIVCDEFSHVLSLTVKEVEELIYK